MWKTRLLLVCQTIWVVRLVQVVIYEFDFVEAERMIFFASWVFLYAIATIGMWRGYAVGWLFSLVVPFVMVMYQFVGALLNNALVFSVFARSYWPELLLLVLFGVNAPTLLAKLSNLSLQRGPAEGGRPLS